MKTSTHHAVMAGAVVGLFCAGRTPVAKADEIPPGVTIERLQYRGTGCRQGTADARIVGSGTAFIILFTEFNAQASPEVSPSENRSRCNVSVHLKYPVGWSFSASSVVYRGNAVLGPGVEAQMEARYHFPGTPSSSAETSTGGPARKVSGPLRQFTTERWSPWARRGTLPVNVDARVDIDNRGSPSSQGIITVEQQDGTFKLQFNLRWQRC